MAQADLLHTPQAEQLLRHREQVMDMARSPNARRLMELLERGGGLDTAARSAMNGDPQQLMQILQRVMSTPEGARTVENISRNIPK